MLLHSAIIILLASLCRGEDLAEGYVESFKSHLKDYSHVLLICTYKDYTVDEAGTKFYQRYYEEATVVRVFKGNSKVSRKLKFFRMIEGRPDIKSNANGELSFVFFDEMADGELLLGTGDGFPFNEKFLQLAEAMQRTSEQDRVDQPATAPQSKPKGKEKTKAEPEARPQ